MLIFGGGGVPCGGLVTDIGDVNIGGGGVRDRYGDDYIMGVGEFRVGVR